MQRTNDVLLAIVEALPPELREKSLPQILTDHAKRDPAYWTRPATSAEIAALLGMSPAALAQWRWRADNGGPPAPPGYVVETYEVVDKDGVVQTKQRRGKYRSRLEVLRWWHEQMGLEQEVAA